MWRRVGSDALREWEWLGISGGETRLLLHRYADCGRRDAEPYEVEFVRNLGRGVVWRRTLYGSDSEEDAVAVARWLRREFERRHGCLERPEYLDG